MRCHCLPGCKVETCSAPCRCHGNRLVPVGADEFVSGGNSFLAILMGICLRNNLSKLYSFAPRKLQSSFWGPCENRAVFKPSFWTAGRRKCPNGPFYWVPNRGILIEMMYTNWNPGEPNNRAGNEDCVHFLGADSESFTWNDTPCGSKNCFVCEVDMWNK